MSVAVKANSTFTGKMSRDKGKRGEREVKKLFESYGFESYRTGSGICTDMPSDVVFKHGNIIYVCEVKFYKNSFKKDYVLLKQYENVYGAIGKTDKNKTYCTTYATVFIQSILEKNLLPIISTSTKESTFNKYQLFKLQEESNVAFANDPQHKKVHLLVKRANNQPWIITFDSEEMPHGEIIMPEGSGTSATRRRNNKQMVSRPKKRKVS